jgi:hypothetical protein
VSALATVLFVITMPMTTLTTLAEEYHCGAADDPIAVQCYTREAKEFLQSWVVAWGDGDVDSYLDHYIHDGSPRINMSRENWEEDRRQRIAAANDIVITLELDSLGIGHDGDLDVIFVQNYRSAGCTDVVKKQLFLVRDGDSYKIQREVSID